MARKITTTVGELKAHISEALKKEKQTLLRESAQKPQVVTESQLARLVEEMADEVMENERFEDMYSDEDGDGDFRDWREYGYGGEDDLDDDGDMYGDGDMYDEGDEYDEDEDMLYDEEEF